MKREPVYSITKEDLKITWFSGTGAGGQHRNKHQNCCRIKHKHTGVISTGQSHKDRKNNLKEALQGLTKNAIFKSYCLMLVHEIKEGMSLEEKVNEMMTYENLKIETRENGNWKEI